MNPNCNCNPENTSQANGACVNILRISRNPINTELIIFYETCLECREGCHNVLSGKLKNVHKQWFVHLQYIN